MNTKAVVEIAKKIKHPVKYEPLPREVQDAEGKVIAKVMFADKYASEPEAETDKVGHFIADALNYFLEEVPIGESK